MKKIDPSTLEPILGTVRGVFFFDYGLFELDNMDLTNSIKIVIHDK